jgi:hypothetical protein
MKFAEDEILDPPLEIAAPVSSALSLADSPQLIEKLFLHCHSLKQPEAAWFRLSNLIIFTLNSVALCGIFFLHIPLYLGRISFSFISTSRQHDLYALALGLAISIGTIATIHHFSTVALNVWQVHIQQQVGEGVDGGGYLRGRLNAVLTVGQRWGSAVYKVLVLVSTMGIIAPLLLGTLFREFLAVPFYVPIFETAADPSGFQNWAIGLVFLRLWIRIMAEGDADQNIDPVPRLAWLRVLQAPLQDTVHTLVLPTLLSLFDAYAGARVIGRVVSPLVFQDPRYVAILQRGSLFIYLVGKGIVSALLAVKRYIASMHNNIRDEYYLLGVTLNNLPPAEGRS